MEKSVRFRGNKILKKIGYNENLKIIPRWATEDKLTQEVAMWQKKFIEADDIFGVFKPGSFYQQQKEIFNTSRMRPGSR